MADLLATLVPVLGRALLHFLWQGAVIGLLAALGLQLLRNARPQARYAVACIALLACVLTPAIGIALQLADATQAPVLVALAPDSRLVGLGALPVVDVSTWPARFEDMLSQGRPLQDMFPMIVALWAAGAGVLSLRMAMGVMWIRRLRAFPQEPVQAVWQSRLDALAQGFGLLRPIALRLVDTLDSPASAGWLRPVVLLPSVLVTRMPVDLIEALLAHELAHIRRHDYLVNLLQGVVEALLFYHPVTWWLSRRIRSEREHIADRLAAEVAVAPRRLALALSELSEWRCESHDARHRPPHLMQAAHGGHLMSRIQQLIQPGRRTAGGKVAFSLLGLAAVCIALYAHAHAAKPESVPPPVAAAVVPVPTVTSGPVLPPRAAEAQVTRIEDDDAKEAYALVRKDQDGFSMSGSSDDIDAIKTARASLDSDFLWFRRDDQAYVVVDPATVARARDAWREVDKLSPQMEALGKQMETHGAKLEVLGAKMKQLAESHKVTPRMDAASRRMEQLGEQQQQLAGQQSRLATEMTQASDTQRETLSAQMDALSGQMDALSEQMDEQSEVLDAESRQLDANQKPMDALARQMEEASKPMEALGAQMEVLGKQQEQHVQAAERELRKLIGAALEQGLAKPVPGTSKQ